MISTERGRIMQHLKNSSYMNEDNAGCNFSKTEEKSTEISEQEKAAKAVSTHDSTLTNPDTPPFKDTQLLSKPSLSYIALIAKVILSSPSQKLNLASIYRAMEEQFPFLKSRGPGWRNSVRHNLSVNDCFVKVDRCEDGRGHYWGVHQAHLRDFQQGNYRQSRKARVGRREREAGSLAWMETSCLLGRLYQSRSSSYVEPQCPLQELQRYQLSTLDWTQPHYQPRSVSAGWVQQSSSWMRRCYFPERLTDSCVRAAAGRWRDSQAMTCRLNFWEMNDQVFTGTQESYDSRFMTPPVQAFRFSGCWCTPPVNRESEKPSHHRVNIYFHP